MTDHRLHCALDIDGVCTCAPRVRVYVGARSGMRDEARACAKLLRAAGIEVTSSWHDDPRFMPMNSLGGGRFTDEQLTGEAERDEHELRRSTAMVRLSDGNPGTAGNCVEWGIARALGLRLILVGPRVHVFDYLTSVVHATAGDDLLMKVLA